MQITIDLPEALQQSLLSQAAQTQTTPEQLIIQLLTQNLVLGVPSYFSRSLPFKPLSRYVVR